MKMRKGAVRTADMVVLGVLAVGVVIGLVAYQNHQRDVAERERIARKEAAKRREADEARERERRLREEEEFERQQRAAKRAREEEENRRLAEESQRRRRQAEAESAQRKLQTDAQLAKGEYRRIAELFAAFTPNLLRLGGDGGVPKKFASERSAYCVFGDFAREKAIYELRLANGRIASVLCRRTDGMPEEVRLAAVTARLAKETHLIATEGMACLRTGNVLATAFDIPEGRGELCVAELHLGAFYDVMVALGAKFPERPCKVTLRSKSGKTTVKIGTFDYASTIRREQLESVMEGILAKRYGVKAQTGAAVTAKKKAFRRKYVKWDGEWVKKGIDGVTHVPQEFVYHYMGKPDPRDKAEAKRKWEELIKLVEEDEQREIEYEGKQLAASEKAQEAERQRAAEQAERFERMTSASAIASGLAQSQLVVE